MVSSFTHACQWQSCLSPFCLLGACTPHQALAITKVLLPETLLVCHVQFSNTLLDIPASKVFHVHSYFSMEKGRFHQLNLDSLCLPRQNCFLLDCGSACLFIWYKCETLESFPINISFQDIQQTANTYLLICLVSFYIFVSPILSKRVWGVYNSFFLKILVCRSDCMFLNWRIIPE